MTTPTDPLSPIALRGGHWWNIKLGDPWGDVSSDDLTLDEIERLETTTDTPWALLNPLSSLKQAKAWLIVAAMHQGATFEEAAAHLVGLNLKGIKGAFQLRTDDRTARLELVSSEGVEPSPPSSAPTSEIG